MPLRSLLLLGLLALMACSTEPSAPAPLPPGAEPFTPEPVYARYWDQMEACSGRSGDFSAVSWYVVPGFEPFPAPGVSQPVLGYWYPADNRIVLLQYVPDPPALIRHEMLHALLQRTDHPRLYFEERCGATIAGPPLPSD